jgi:hypothetical protein
MGVLRQTANLRTICSEHPIEHLYTYFKHKLACPKPRLAPVTIASVAIFAKRRCKIKNIYCRHAYFREFFSDAPIHFPGMYTRPYFTNRWVSLAAGMISLIASGTLYLVCLLTRFTIDSLQFPVYASNLKTHLRMSSSDTNFIIAIGNVGGSVRLLPF